MRGISIIVLGSALALAAATAPLARADVEGDVRSGDKILGTILPGSETERWTIACPADSKLKVTLKGPKKKSGGAVSFRLLDDVGDPIVGPVIQPKGTGAKLSRYDIPASGEYTVEVFAVDGETGGDYKLTIVCAAPRKLTFDATLDGDEHDFGFFSVLGTVVKAKLKAGSGSDAAPILLRLLGPDAYDEPINVGPPKGVASPKIELPRTGEFELLFGGDGGEASGKLTLKAKKSVKRTIDVSSNAIDPGGDGGEEAVVGVIGSGGGSLVAPDDGDNPVGIGGAGVDIPAGALQGAVAIVIATAPPIGPQEDTQDGAGNTVFFGPEGLQFSEDATLTLPFDPLLVQSEDDVRVYTRNASGHVVLIDPSTYDVNLAAGTVTVPTSHFSSFRVFNERGLLDVETVAFGFTAPTDVIQAPYTLGGGGAVGKAAVSSGRGFGSFLVAHGERIDHVYADYFTGITTVTPFAGGGQSTQPGSQALDFDFPGNITALETDGFTVFAATATQIFVLESNDGPYEVQPFAGTGVAGDSGDGGQAIDAEFTQIVDLLWAFTRFEETELIVVDRGAKRIRSIVLGDGHIETGMGTGTAGVGVDGEPLATSPLLDPTAITPAPVRGQFFVADAGRIRLVGDTDDQVPVEINQTFAGPPNGARGNGADNVSRQNARFQEISGLAFDFFSNSLFVSDRGTHTVQEIDAVPGGIVRRVIGTRGTALGTPGDFTAPGTLNLPDALLFDFGNLILVEAGTGELRCVTVSEPSFSIER